MLVQEENVGEPPLRKYYARGAWLVTYGALSREGEPPLDERLAGPQLWSPEDGPALAFAASTSGC